MKDDQALEELFRELNGLSKDKDIRFFSCFHQFRETGTTMPKVSQKAHDFLFFDYLTLI